MKIDAKHLLQNEDTEEIVSHMECPKNSKKFKSGLPNSIVIHYTAGRNAESSAKFLCKDNIKASAHVVIGRDGQIIQLVPFNIISWHAGASSWKNMSGLNNYSIGIEIDNAGPLTKQGNKYVSWFKKSYAEEDVVHATHRNETKPRYWHEYTDAQIEAVQDLCALLLEKFPIKYILGHEEISPGRKQDPGPAFPLDKLRELLLSNDRAIDELSLQGKVTADRLNIRAEPSIEGELVAEALASGTIVDIIKEEQNWYLVKIDKLSGYVSARYIEIINK